MGKMIDADYLIESIKSEIAAHNDDNSALDLMTKAVLRELISILNDLPTAQPEIIHCQNCERYHENFHWCTLHDGEFSLTDFCSYADRRADGKADKGASR